jgi:hypothetical protein
VVVCDRGLAPLAPDQNQGQPHQGSPQSPCAHRGDQVPEMCRLLACVGHRVPVISVMHWLSLNMDLATPEYQGGQGRRSTLSLCGSRLGKPSSRFRPP